MLRSLRRSVGMLAARFRYRKSREKVISFSHALPEAESVLIILPLWPAAGADHLVLLAPYRARFEEGHMTVVTTLSRDSFERLLPRSRVITIAPDEVNPFFLPRQVVIDRVHARQYDLAVDLNLDFILPSGYICRESHARIRAGFANPHADTFYNFQVRLDPDSHRGNAYERLAHCLTMFFAEEGV
ncbi:MAG: hypothetical protein AB1428_01975 [Bacteroidota bacterium]